MIFDFQKVQIKNSTFAQDEVLVLLHITLIGDKSYIYYHDNGEIFALWLYIDNFNQCTIYLYIYI